MTIFNPAYTGTQEAPMLSMSYRSQWSGIDGAPVVQAFSFGTPTSNERVGIGLSIINDEIFIQRQTHAYVNFSYKLPMSVGMNVLLANLKASEIGLDLEIHYSDSVVNLMDSNKSVVYNQYPDPEKNNKYFVSIGSLVILDASLSVNLDSMYTSATDRVHFYASGGLNLFVSDR